MTEYTYQLEFIAPVGVFTGLGIAGLVDRTVVRMSDGRPYIPGSTVKGRLRFFAERVWRPDQAEGSGLGKPHVGGYCKHLDSACALCRLFGNPALAALVSVGQATLETSAQQAEPETPSNPVLHADAEILPGVALSRRRRTALADHLFFDETIPATVFKGRLLVDERLREAEIRFLAGVGAIVDSLGGRKAAGRGRLKGGIQVQGRALS